MKKSEFLKALSEIKIGQTRSCLVHVSLIDLGIFTDLKINKINNFIFNSLKKFTKKNCTISTLTPFYEYADKNREFDIIKSLPSKTIGDFAKFIYLKKKTLRSSNPLFNISSVGPLAKKITLNSTPEDFGYNSPWDNLYKIDTDMIFIGCDLSRCTFIRFIENRFNVPYLIKKVFQTKIKSKGKILFENSFSVLRNLNLNVVYNSKKYQKILMKKKILRVNSHPKFKIMALNMKPAFQVGIQQLKKDKYFFINKQTLKLK